MSITRDQVQKVALLGRLELSEHELDVMTGQLGKIVAYIDQLAERGVRFERAYCQYPLCGPSRASFMTGLYPDQTLVHRNAVYIRERVPNVQTMAQMFRDAGYLATRIGKIYHYNVPKHIGTSGHDDPYSWDYTINPRGRDRDDEDLIFSLRPGRFGGTLSWLASGGTDAEQTDGIAANHAVRLLRQYAREKRSFFLAVGLFRPHTPYVAPKRYFEMYTPESIVVPTVPGGYLDTLPTLNHQLIRDFDRVMARLGHRELYELPVMSSRGCPYDCTFCSVSRMFGRRIRRQSVEKVYRDLASYVEQGFRQFFFYDDNFTANRAWLRELMQAVAPLRVRFDAQTRADFP